MIKECIEELIKGKNLDSECMVSAMEEIMEGRANEASVGAFLSLLRAKGETVNEITMAARVMREKAERIKISGEVIDTCSTGGTGINHFNISTAAAFVAAGAGARVAKHGNRAVSGKCGSADILQELGINIEMPPRQAAECIEEIGIAFLFAPLFHRAMKNAAGPRRNLGIRTVFNILGPLCNPSGASGQLLGVFDEKLTSPLARVLKNLGTKRAMVVHGKGGLDEITLSDSTKVSELKEGKIHEYELLPRDFGLSKVSMEELKGSDAKNNSRTLFKLLKGEKSGVRDVVLANAAAAFLIAGKASDLKEGLEAARQSLDSGRALEKLKELKDFSLKK